jgi:ABC-type nickel/cobalt efflux system permease component RcnA
MNFILLKTTLCVQIKRFDGSGGLPETMSQELSILAVTAASIGFLHTLFGPDHYLPFIVLAKARKWRLGKTVFITSLCGLGHILSSVLLGLAGIVFGIAVSRLTGLEAFRGTIAGWLITGFGFAYLVWGIRQALRQREHSHPHAHENGSHHHHLHAHLHQHAHPHLKERGENMTPWVLFIIFVFGPCEPLIPILMYPAAQHSLGGMLLVTGIFGFVTLSTMLSIVLLFLRGLDQLPLGRMERFSHALAGAALFLCGLSIQLLGL